MNIVFFFVVCFWPDTSTGLLKEVDVAATQEDCEPALRGQVPQAAVGQVATAVYDKTPVPAPDGDRGGATLLGTAVAGT
jgi:hypothetical protein